MGINYYAVRNTVELLHHDVSRLSTDTRHGDELRNIVGNDALMPGHELAAKALDAPGFVVIEAGRVNQCFDFCNIRTGEFRRGFEPTK